MFLRGKHILLGVTGGIAAYKAAMLVRELRRCGAEVQVVMTRAAEKFVGAATFHGLSGRRVETDLFDKPENSRKGDADEDDGGMKHIELSRWADFLLIVPASANTLAKFAHGYADDLLTSIYLAGDMPAAVAPAMNYLMWQHPATRANLRTLEQRGVLVWGPGEGEQACGETGAGRLLEPPEIINRLSETFSHETLAGYKVVVTAGPTREVLDAVRCLSNHSSGKMGFALARAAREQGAEVVLIAGPAPLPTPPSVRRVDVVTAEEMHAAVFEHIEGAAMFISCAAVADYRPLAPKHRTKIKKNEEMLQLHLIRTRDILAEVAALDSHRPFVIGFAAETHDVAANAKSKLLMKNLDMIVASQVGPDAPYSFGNDEALVEVYWRGGGESIGPGPKTALSNQLMSLFIRRYQSRHPSKTHAQKHTG